MRCRMLVGRDAELRTLTGALEAAAGARAGSGLPAGGPSGQRRAEPGRNVIFLAGEPGVGKSRLAREASAAAEARGFMVLTGGAVQAGNPLPLGPIVEALAQVARRMTLPGTPDLAEYRPVLTSLVLRLAAQLHEGESGQGMASPGGDRHGAHGARPETSPLILGEAMLRLLVALASGRAGVLLIIEDLQFADPETLAIVEYLADNLAGEPVLCVGTVRDSEPSPGLDAVRAVHARRSATLVELSRLDAADVARMAGDCLGYSAVPEPVLGRLLAECDGLPFAVEEILAAAVSSGELVPGNAGWRVREDVETPVPASIAGSIRSRLAGLGPHAAGILTAAAVLGRQFEWTLLPPVVAAPEADVLAALRRARAVQLVEPSPGALETFRFRHSLTRDVVLSGLPPSQLAETAARAAAAVDAAHPGLPGRWCELAARLRETAGQRAEAAGLLLLSGRRALDEGALASAAAALNRARQVAAGPAGAPPQLAAEIDEALTTVHMLSGDCDHLVQVAERLLAELDELGAAASRKAMIRLRVARALSEGNRLSDARGQVAAARALAGAVPDPALAAWTGAVEARCAIDEGDPDRADALAHRALAAAESAGLARGTAEAACEALEIIGRRERPRDTAAASAAFERAYQIASSRRLPVWRIRALHELGTIDMLREVGSARLAQARSLAQEAGAVSMVAVLDLQLANAWSLGTDLDRAVAAAERSQRAARRLRMPKVEAMAWATLACILAGREGERQRAEAAAAEAERISAGDPNVLTATWGEARVTAAIVANDLPAALAASVTGVAYARPEPLMGPSMAWGYWPLLSAVLGEDARAAVREATAAGAEVACWNSGCLAYARAVLAGRDGRPALAAEQAARGEACFRRCAPRWNHIMHRLVAPLAFRDRWGEPALWLRAAIADLDAEGLHGLASACRDTLREVGERVPRAGRGLASVPAGLRGLGVTSREMDVFLLIGQGRTNAEIASRLQLSRKTVETHVASLASKVGVDGRRGLAAFAARAAGG